MSPIGAVTRPSTTPLTPSILSSSIPVAPASRTTTQAGVENEPKGTEAVVTIEPTATAPGITSRGEDGLTNSEMGYIVVGALAAAATLTVLGCVGGGAGRRSSVEGGEHDGGEGDGE